MDVHLRGLRCFVAVAEHLSFTRAAAALFVSQPTLSKQVRSLEDNLRVQLFARNRRSVQLTEAGGALLPGAAVVLRAWEAAQADMTEVMETAKAVGWAPLEETVVGEDQLAVVPVVGAVPDAPDVGRRHARRR